MKRVLGFYLPLAVAVLWVGMMVYHHVIPPSAETRRQDVIAEFLDRSILLERQSLREASRMIAATRSAEFLHDHVHPDLLKWLEEASGQSAEDIRTNANVTSMALAQALRVVEHSSNPNEHIHGETEEWSWSIVPVQMRLSLTKDTGSQPAGTIIESCAVTLLFWDKQNWFVAPATTEVEQLAIASAFPGTFPNDELMEARACVRDFQIIQ